MRRSLVLVPLMLGGCGMLPPNVPPRFEGMCNADAAQQFVGQAVSQQAGDSIKQATGATFVRWIGPGMMVTQDFSPARVNIRTTPDYRIAAVTCG